MCPSRFTPPKGLSSTLKAGGPYAGQRKRERGTAWGPCERLIDCETRSIVALASPQDETTAKTFHKCLGIDV
ncbi:hypothetical protein SNOG_16480 [Parastagonospora nodorum SN15]|uniref:Uncharacterized protein n=1 Tax=Phaeosphaeria nodorum (strain SN15 / ATCC MYA-4574 / FGSC 10173) TaxID=321614 RepID=Q0TVI4_PHANO|nr:hypothetical protein SNOG_16480 [Parastagonospora nodorum SN15]EAT76178.1 hypothetical protein SNOG_16480 [Parastagonospora nodorum SN15]